MRILDALRILRKVAAAAPDARNGIESSRKVNNISRAAIPNTLLADAEQRVMMIFEGRAIYPDTFFTRHA